MKLKKLIYPIILVVLLCAVYYKLFIFGRIPFPGDLLAVSYAPWFDTIKLPVQNPQISDVFSQFYLWKNLSIESFRHFQWPLWNPYSFTGTPLLATYHSAALYPINLILLLPSHFGWGFFIFSQTLLAGLLMYLFLSLWLEARLSRVVGALIFSLGGLMTTWAELGTSCHALAWLPLSLWGIEKYLRHHKIKYLFVFTLGMVLTTLAGNVQITTYSYLIVGGFILMRLYGQTLREVITHIKLLIPFIFFSLFLSAPQLLPTLELFSKSIRLSDSYTAIDQFGLLPIQEIFKLYSADFFGNPVTRNYWGFLNYSETSSFLGTATLPLLIFGVFFLKKNRIVIFFLTLFILSLFLAFYNPISYLIYQTKVPILTLSYASRIIFITTFTAAIIAAFSLNQILTLTNQQIKTFKVLLWSWATLVGTVIGILSVELILKHTLISSPSKFYTTIYLDDPYYLVNNFRIALKNTLLPLVIISLLLSVFIIQKLAVKLSFFKKFLTPNKQMMIISIVFTSLIALDLGRYFTKFNPFVSSSLIFPSASALEYLQKQPGIFRIGREHAEVLPPNTWINYNLQSLEGYDPLYLNLYGKYMTFLNGGDPRVSGTGRYAELSAKYSSPFIDIANVKYFIGVGRDREGRVFGDFIDDKFQKANYNIVFKEGSTVIFQNPKALERAYFITSVTTASVPKTLDIFMTDPQFDPTKTVILSSDLGANSITGKGEINIKSYQPNLVNLTTKTEHDEILILADQFDEGWKAKIDNTDTPVSRANLIFRAIKVPSGTHNITFYYWPDSFGLGLKIFLGSATALLLIAFITLRKKTF